jgi:endonuclease/exonuclease/phosphatase family metal-dependent hydrolase
MTTLRVMTFNVRQPDKDDGEDRWEARRDLLIDTIIGAHPDVIGTQELFLLQAEYILDHMPQYGWFGTGRYGDQRDKHVGIFYRKDRFRVAASGDLWLSTTPEVPGSSSWDIITPRQLTWGVLDARDIGSFWVLNTHFPYRPCEEEARRNTAQLIRDRLEAISSSAPVIVTADFNSPADGEIYRLLRTDLRDAWCDAAMRLGPPGTLNGFGRHQSDRRIDWILYRGGWRVREAETITAHRDGRYPSDHFPVIATFETGA